MLGHRPELPCKVPSERVSGQDPEHHASHPSQTETCRIWLKTLQPLPFHPSSGIGILWPPEELEFWRRTTACCVILLFLRLSSQPVPSFYLRHNRFCDLPERPWPAPTSEGSLGGQGPCSRVCPREKSTLIAGVLSQNLWGPGPV